MSKELNIADKTYYYDCNVKGETIEYLLYDFNVTWKATKTKEEVLQTLQLLNKRIKYDVGIAFDTLQNALPESGTWIGNDNQPETSNASERVLKLKYRVKECPFHFEWRLKQHNNPLTIQLPIGQVASLVDVLPAKIEELLEILQHKEAEIKQYRREYGSLRRSTLATNDFDMAMFREQYAAADVSVKSLQRVVARWRSEHGDAECELESLYHNKSSPTNIIKKEEARTSASSASKSVQESPRSRKRKALHSYKTQMMRSLQSASKDLQYESQSQSLSEHEQEDIREVKKVRRNVEGVDNVIVKEVVAGKSVNTPIKLKAEEMPTKAPTNPIIKDSSAPEKEVARSYKRMQYF
uniref:Non-homologous end-joining factor 1 n=1 Tax=Bactrocera latifrons TaxID=174628 RepID=A0A0K8VFR8_BACLA